MHTITAAGPLGGVPSSWVGSCSQENSLLAQDFGNTTSPCRSYSDGPFECRGVDHLRLELERKILILMQEYQQIEMKMQTIGAQTSVNQPCLGGGRIINHMNLDCNDVVEDNFADSPLEPAKVFPSPTAATLAESSPAYVTPPPGLDVLSKAFASTNRAGSYASSTSTSAASHLTAGDYVRGSTCEEHGVSSEEDYTGSEPVTIASSATGAIYVREILSKEELQAMQNVALAGGGLSGCTTVMIRELPVGCSQKRLLRELDNADFSGQYDFFYMPVDPRARSNRGFAFVNFLSLEISDRFYNKFDNQIVTQLGCTETAIRIVPADVQGFDANFAQFNAPSKKGKRRITHSKPIFLPQARGAAGLAAAGVPPAFAVPKSQTTSQKESAACRSAFEVAAVAAAVPAPSAAVRGPRFCTACGASRPARIGHLFCESCGARLSEMGPDF